MRSRFDDLRPLIILSIGSPPPEKSDAVERLPEDSEESVNNESEDSAAAGVRKERVLGCRHVGQGGQDDLSSFEGENLKREESFINIIIFFFLVNIFLFFLYESDLGFFLGRVLNLIWRFKI